MPKYFGTARDVDSQFEPLIRVVQGSSVDGYRRNAVCDPFVWQSLVCAASATPRIKTRFAMFELCSAFSRLEPEKNKNKKRFFAITGSQLPATAYSVLRVELINLDFQAMSLNYSVLLLPG